MVPPKALSPSALLRGILSPVSIDSSTEVSPPVTIPSTGIFSPGLIISFSPTCTSIMETSFSVPSLITLAIPGRKSISFLIASPALPFAFVSKNLPRSINVIIIEADSK